MYELELHSLTASVLPDPVGFYKFSFEITSRKTSIPRQVQRVSNTSVTQACVLSRHYRHGVLLSIKSYNQEVTFTFNVHF